MFGPTGNTSLVKNTSHKVVVPFYVYAAVSLLAATILLLTSTGAFTQHYFHPYTLAITHAMALGWGTMVILGASHQLVPVLIESKLYSNALAYASFVLAAIGIPLLVYGFFTFDMGAAAQWGGILVNASIVCYLVNLLLSISQSKKENVHAVFVFTAAVWLFITTLVGLLLVYNFTFNFLPQDSVHYLSLHAHLGIVGWFLLLVIGVGSRLIPMFLISKYNNPRLLWVIYYIINIALAAFIFIFIYAGKQTLFIMPVIAVAIALVLFAFYCYNAYKQRIRKKVDDQMKVSMLSVVMMLLPVLLLLGIIIILLYTGGDQQLVLLYGFSIFFGWITAIIFGMTFKTLPFIIWNKLYHHRAGLGKTPNPKELFSDKVFKAMSVCYLAGFVLFSAGIYTSIIIVLQTGSVLLLLAALLYNWNIIKMLFHKPATP